MKRRIIRWGMVLIALLSVVSWIDSYFHDVWVLKEHPPQGFTIVREPGTVLICRTFGLHSFKRPSGFHVSYKATQGAVTAEKIGPATWAAPGLAVHIEPNRGGMGVDALVISHALLTGVLVALAALAWRLTRTRRKRHQCLACGYDLRGLANDAACPECGVTNSGGPPREPAP